MWGCNCRPWRQEGRRFDEYLCVRTNTRLCTLQLCTLKKFSLLKIRVYLYTLSRCFAQNSNTH